MIGQNFSASATAAIPIGPASASMVTKSGMYMLDGIGLDLICQPGGLDAREAVHRCGRDVEQHAAHAIRLQSEFAEQRPRDRALHSVGELIERAAVAQLAEGGGENRGDFPLRKIQ